MDIPQEVIKYGKHMELTQLQRYVQRVFSLLQSMKTDSTLVVANVAKEENTQLFIEVVKFYMRSTSWQGGLTFSNNYSKIKRGHIPVMTAKEGSAAAAGSSRGKQNDGTSGAISS